MEQLSATVGTAPSPGWLDTDWLLSQFGSERWSAIAAYREFVLAGLGKPSPLEQVRHQTLLGDDMFLARHKTGARGGNLREVSKAYRRSVAFDLEAYRERYPERSEAMARAYLSGAYTMAEIGAFFGVHSMTVSRAVKSFGRIKVREETR